MSELLENCNPFVFRNRAYQVAPRDIYIESQFSLWVMAEAAIALDRLRSFVPPTFYREQAEIFGAKVAGKAFDWERKEVYDASTSKSGEKQLLYLKMKRGEAKGGAACERELIDEIEKDRVKWDELIGILYRQDYPEVYSSFLAQQAEREKKREEAKERETAEQGPLASSSTSPPESTLTGPHQATGAMSQSTQSQPEKVSPST